MAPEIRSRRWKPDKCALVKSVLDDLQWCHMLAIIKCTKGWEGAGGLMPFPPEVLARYDLRDGSIQLSTADTAGQYLLTTCTYYE